VICENPVFTVRTVTWVWWD